MSSPIVEIVVKVENNNIRFIRNDEIRERIRKAIAVYAQNVKELAQERVPVRTHILQNSINFEPYSSEAEKESTIIGTSVEYSKYVEPEPLGVPMIRKMKRTPYLWNSANDLMPLLVEHIENAFKNITK